MSENKKIPEFENYEEMAEFWDTHDLTDYWEQTEPAEFEISPQARRRYLVSLDRNLLLRIQKIARIRGITTESLINLFLEQHLNEIEAQT
jgi:predicted DNA binding CopG/RHH family protein